MDLVIKQYIDRTETVSSSLIDALYHLTKPDSSTGQPAANAVLVGRIQSAAAYEDAVNFLNTQFSAANSDNGSDFQVNVLNNNYYIRFADPEVVRVLTENGIMEEGGGLTVAQASVANVNFRGLFANNTVVKNFDELRYFDKYKTTGGSGAQEIFKNAVNLESVDLTGITSTYLYYAFKGCHSLEWYHGKSGPKNVLNMQLRSVSGIQAYAFFENYGLHEVTSLGIVTILDGNCFKKCTNLTTIDISNITTIGASVFEGDENLEYFSGSDSTAGELNLLNLTGTLGNSAFKGCTKLTSVASLGSITSIGDSAFENCVNLATINIPNTVTSIGAVAFNNTAWLNNQPTGPVYINNVLYKYKADSATSYTAPSNVTYITERAFKECTNLASVDLSNLSITALGNNTFESCENLQTAVLPNTITSLGSNIFYRCHNLQTANIPSGITTLKDGTFRECYRLQSVTIPNSVTNIERLVFSSCDLLSIHIPALLTSFAVGYYSTFSSNKNCTVITVDSNNTKYDSRDNCNAIIETANNKLVWGCAGTVIPNSVTSIGDYAFQSMLGVAVTAFTIPSNVDTIGSRVFDDCVGLVSLTVERMTPPSVGTELFYGKNMPVPNIYVPSDSVDAYKSASGWSTYADKIQAIQT